MPTTIADILKDAEHRMQSAFEATLEDFRHIRTGRANPMMLDGVMVDDYWNPHADHPGREYLRTGTRLLLISPWDKSLLGPISKAILTSDPASTPTTMARSFAWCCRR